MKPIYSDEEQKAKKKERAHNRYLKNKDIFIEKAKQYRIDHPGCYKDRPSYKKKLTGERILLRNMSDEEKEARRKKLRKKYIKDNPEKFKYNKVLKSGTKAFDDYLNKIQFQDSFKR